MIENTTNTKSIKSEAFGLAGLAPIEVNSDFASHPGSEARIPELSTDHLFTKEVYETLALWWRLGKAEPLYISGPSGSGKTSTALQFAARLGLPVVTVTARARMDRRELIGHWTVAAGETRWVDGPAVTAWRNGWLLLINEFSAAPADVWVSCNDILEGSAIDIADTGEVVRRHPLTRVIVTDNTRGHSSEIDEGFFGRQIQDRSVIDRFWHMRMEGLSEEDEARLLKKTAGPALSRPYDADTVARLCRALAKAGADSRKSAADAAIGFDNRAVAISHRALARLRDMILSTAVNAERPALQTLCRLALTEALDSSAREAAETLITTAVAGLPDALARSAKASRKPSLI